ncbi:MAG TPA: T9SS C-terminal target domain-containing protein, partial [Bacteroidia bacterium]
MNKHTYIILIITAWLLLMSSNSSAQAPAIEWQKMLGGTSTDQGYYVEQTTDSGYVVAGRALSIDGDVIFNHDTGTFDAWIIKLSKDGVIQWQKTLGGSQDDEAHCVRQTNDGGYIVAGFTFSSDGDVTLNKGACDYWIVKLDAAGNIQWQKTYGGTVDDRAVSIEQTHEGGYIVGGRSNSYNGDVIGHHGSQSKRDLWVIKIDNSGNLQWQNSLGGSENDDCTAIHQTTDGGYIVSGYTKSNDHDVSGLHGNTWPDAWVVKLDSLGSIQWQKTLGGSETEDAQDIVQCANGEYMLAGYTASSDGDITSISNGSSGYIWVVKIDSTGNLIWEDTYGGSNGNWATSIIKTDDDSFVIGGNTWSNDGDVSGNHGLLDCWVFKIDSIGVIKWSKSMGGSVGDELNSIQQTMDGGFVFCGESNSNDGDVSGLHVSGSLKDIWVVKLGPEAVGLPDAPWLQSMAMYPNPATDKLYIRTEKNEELQISLSDLNGK